MTRSLQNLMENSPFQKSHCNAIRSQGQHLENTERFLFVFSFFLKSSTLLVFQTLSGFLFPCFLPFQWGLLIFTEDIEKIGEISSSLFAFQKYILRLSSSQLPETVVYLWN